MNSQSQNPSTNTIPNIIFKWSNETPENDAILSLGKTSISYSKLYLQIQYIVDTLRNYGVNRNDRVAVVLPNGPDMAVTFLGVSSCASCVPLNPRYTFNEYDFYLNDIQAKTLITKTKEKNPVIDVAEKNGIDVINLDSSSNGLFSLSKKDEIGKPSDQGFVYSDDIALILHTSGTTSRPKIVPLTHKNLLTSAKNIAQTLNLTQKDRCLNIMPLFHIHGLIGATLSTLYAGASLVATPGFLVTQFFRWIEEFQPTWYTAVPTMHQRILSRASENENIIKNAKLRLIRSSSSALPPKVMKDLETIFEVPVIESYGMTEASHQMASNPLPPKIRKSGTVGLPAGPEIVILDEEGIILSQGEAGEIAIRGKNVITSYENNPEANIKSFTNGWFRTGDEGFFDEDNYLVIKDRIKEIINRGGEKISPREVDEIILDHDAVKQVVTFSVPHPLLGEDVGAAIVLNEDSNVTQRDIREYVSKYLASYKVPRYIVFLDDIPKGPTGKLQRIGLADKLGIEVKTYDDVTEYKAPSNETERLIANIWSEVLEIQKIGVTDNYFQRGGDSILGAQIVSKISEKTGKETMPLAVFLYAPTIQEMAKIIDEGDQIITTSSLIALRQNGSKTPIYCVHSSEGKIQFLKPLAQELGEDQPFYGLRAQGLDKNQKPHETIEEMSQHYLREIEAFQPIGPYILAGAGVGGLVALDMAANLTSRSKKVEKLLLFDSIYWSHFDLNSFSENLGELKRNISALFLSGSKLFNKIRKAGETYKPKKYSGHTILFVSETPQNPDLDVDIRKSMWEDVIIDKLEIHVVPGKHLDILKKPNVRVLANQLKLHLG